MSTCGCGCGESHGYSKFHVEPAMVQWFVDNAHKKKYLDARGAAHDADIAAKPVTS